MTDPRDDFATRPFVETSAPDLVRSVQCTLEDGRSAILTARPAVIGRAAGCDLRLAHPTVSAFHLEARAEGGGIRIVDVKSLNGTFYAAAKVHDAIVPSGATVTLGGVNVRFDLGPTQQDTTAGPPAFGDLRGASNTMRELLATLARLARTDLSVVIQGPTGTGKELAARALHDASTRARGPFVVLDCTSVPATLAEGLLFGHERGAFTGATEARAGLFESASGGTIFLDEVGELSAELQPKLLRVLERREVVRVGASQPRPVNVRVVAATWRDLRAMINQNTFREDLYYRLAQARVVLPPLADRRGDIPMLVHHFLAGRDRALGGARTITPEALAELSRREYPGNVRELRNAVERAAALSMGAAITPEDLAFERMVGAEGGRGRPAEIQTAPTSAVGPDDPIGSFKTGKQSVVEAFERDYLTRLLSRTGNNLSRAASLAGLDRNYLRDLCRRHGLRSVD